MAKLLIILLLIITTGCCNTPQVVSCINFIHCDVYQFEGTDSTKKALVLSQVFNENGQLATETYTNYITSPSNYIVDHTAYCFYVDTLLVKRISCEENNDSLKFIYSYNDKNQLIKEERFSFERRLKVEALMRMAHLREDDFTDDDFEPEGSWRKERIKNYLYNRQGRMILHDETTPFLDPTNKYTWEYDNFGRVTKYSNFSRRRLFYTDEYTYSNNGYSFIRIFYDYNGQPYPQNEENWLYETKIHSFKLNNKGQVTEEKVSTKKGKVINTITSTYNEHGLVARTVYYDSNGAPLITTIYAYYN